MGAACGSGQDEAIDERGSGLTVRVSSAPGVLLADVDLDLFGLARLEIERLDGELALNDGLRLFVEDDRAVRASWLSADGFRVEAEAELPADLPGSEGEVRIVLGDEPAVLFERTRVTPR